MTRGTHTSAVEPALAADLSVVARQGENYLVVPLRDGRILALPLDLYPLLLHATPKQRANWRIIGRGFHWPDLDLDLSVAGMFAGTPDLTARARKLQRPARSARWVARHTGIAGRRASRA